MSALEDLRRQIKIATERNKRMAIVGKTNPYTTTSATSATLDDSYTIRAAGSYPRTDKDTPMTIYPTANGYIVAPYDLFTGNHNHGYPIDHLMKQVYVCTTIEQAHTFLVMHWSGLAKQAKEDGSEAVASAV